MIAAVFRGPGRLDVETVPEPSCPAGGLLLGISACAVCGSDVRIVAAGHHRISPPQVLGHELVGTIIASDAADQPVGGRVTVAPAIGCGECRHCRAGRTNRCPALRTIGYQFAGAFAERMAVPAEAVAQGHVLALPDDLPDELAALTEPLACCLNGQELVGLAADEMVVTVGCGPIGLMHALLARAAGARVLLVEQRPERLARAVAMGLGEAVEPADIRARTDGGADVVIVAAPSAAAQAACLEWLAPGGRASYFGGLPPGAPAVALETNEIHYRELTVVGAHGSTAAQNRAALALISGVLRSDAAQLITHRFALAQAAEAIEAARSGAGLKGVVQVG